MGKKKKGNTNLLPVIALGGALFFFGGSKKKSNSGNQKPTGDQHDNTGTDDSGLLADLKDYHFDTVDDITSPVSSDIIPYIVPASFVIERVSDKFYKNVTVQEYPKVTQKEFIDVAKISFLICIYCPPTSLGSLGIEDVFFDDIQIVRYINDQQQQWINIGDLGTRNAVQLKEIASQMVGLDVHSGNNLFNISFYCIPDKNLSESKAEELTNYSFEAVSIGMNIKFEETRMAHWRMLSAWNIMEDTLINEGDALGTNTRFGIVRNAESKPRDQRGLFSEWWADYVQAGYDTNIVNLYTSQEFIPEIAIY